MEVHSAHESLHSLPVFRLFPIQDVLHFSWVHKDPLCCHQTSQYHGLSSKELALFHSKSKSSLVCQSFQHFQHSFFMAISFCGDRNIINKGRPTQRSK